MLKRFVELEPQSACGAWNIFSWKVSNCWVKSCSVSGIAQGAADSSDKLVFFYLSCWPFNLSSKQIFGALGKPVTNQRILFNLAMAECCTSLWGLVHSSDSQTTSASLHWQFLRWPLEGKGASIIFWNDGDSQWNNCRCVQKAQTKCAGWTPACCHGWIHWLYLFLFAYTALIADGTMWCMDFRVLSLLKSKEHA